MSDRAIPIETLLEYEPFVRALLRGLIRDESEVQDLVQETWVRALRRPPSDSGSPKGWLARIAHNLARDSHRRSSARQVRELAVARPEASDGLATSERRLRLHQRLVDAVMSLDEPYRGVVILKHYEDMEPAQIAAKLKRNVATVRSHLHRAHGLLRAKLDGEFESRSSWMAVALPMAKAPVTGASIASPLYSVGSGSLVIMKKLILAVVVAAFVGGAVWLLNREPELPATARGAEVALVREEQSTMKEGAALRAPKSADARDTNAREPVRSLAAESTPDIPHAGERALRIRVVDSDAREPVPFFALDARSEREQRSFVTGIAGAASWAAALLGPLEFNWREDGVAQPDASFESSSEPAGASGAATPSLAALPVVKTAWLTSLDRAKEQAAERAHVETWEFTDASDEHTLVVAVGPTWILSPTLPDGLALDAQLPLTAALRRTDYESWKVTTSVQRTGDVLWVRFDSTDVAPLAAGHALLLELRSQDGMWTGQAAVERSTGFTPEPLTIKLEACATVSGHVHDAHGDPIRGQVVSFQYAGAEETAHAMTDAAGFYRATWLRPGFGTAYVADPAFESFEHQLVLQAATNHELDITLLERAGGGVLSGVIESATGTFQGRVFLFVDGVEGTSYWARADPSFKDEQGTWRAKFSINDVPPGRFRLTCNTTEPYAILDAERTVDSPNDTLRFVVADDLPPRRIEFNAIASTASGGVEPLDFTLRYVVDGGYTRTVESASGEPLAVEIPRNATVIWAVFADGHQPASGDDSAFDNDALTVQLEPGWGARLHLLEIESLSDLVGIEIFADGLAVGRTDARGELTLSLPVPPERIHFDETRWLVHNSGTFSSDLDPTTGALLERSEASYLAAYLRPAR